VDSFPPCAEWEAYISVLMSLLQIPLISHFDDIIEGLEKARLSLYRWWWP
jgi:hypothetical protein